MSPQKTFLALCLSAVLCGTASALPMLPLSEVMRTATPHDGKIASLIIPSTWKLGSFDTASWFDLQAKEGRNTTKTLRISVEKMFSRDEAEFQKKVEEYASKAGARLQSFVIDDVLFRFYVVQSPYQDPRRPGTEYTMTMYADWPRENPPKHRSFRDALKLTISERPLLGVDGAAAPKPEQMEQLLRQGLLPDTEVQAIIQSIVFTGCPGKEYHSSLAALRGANQEVTSRKDMVLRQAAIGRISGEWKPVELRISGRVLRGQEMLDAAGARLKEFYFDAAGSFRMEPRDESWGLDQRGNYIFGDMSAKIWIEKDRLNYRDALGYHFIYERIPSENPSDPELLAAALGEWVPVEVIIPAQNGETGFGAVRGYMGTELSRGIIASGLKARPLSVRPDGTLHDGQRFGSWRLSDGRFVMDFEKHSYMLCQDHIEELSPSGVRVIFARQGTENAHRSVRLREFLTQEKLAAETEPLVGLWKVVGAIDRFGKEISSSQLANITASYRPMQFTSAGQIVYDGRATGLWKNEGGIYVFEGDRAIQIKKPSFQDGRITTILNSSTTVLYEKVPFEDLLRN